MSAFLNKYSKMLLCRVCNCFPFYACRFLQFRQNSCQYIPISFSLNHYFQTTSLVKIYPSNSQFYIYTKCSSNPGCDVTCTFLLHLHNSRWSRNKMLWQTNHTKRICTFISGLLFIQIQQFFFNYFQPHVHLCPCYLMVR